MSVFVQQLRILWIFCICFGQSPQELRLGNVCPGAFGGCDYDPDDRIVFYHKQQRGKIYIAVIHYTGDQAGDEVIRCFGKRKYFVKSKTMRKEKTEMAVELYCRQNDMDFMEKIRSIEDVEDVTLIQYNGEYHG